MSEKGRKNGLNGGSGGVARVRKERKSVIPLNRPLPAGACIPRHGNGWIMPWQKGKSGNPGGHQGVKWAEVLAICREFSPEATRILIKIASDPGEDSRARIVAIQELNNRAWGKPRERMDAEDREPELDLSGLTDAELAVLEKLGAPRTPAGGLAGGMIDGFADDG
ncbi:hypothetical protein AiwAL_15955 [Acidiphilium sp. AL]|uniref:hypothetical protein n=1 Tax=Acidiphilium sp. AL TaxID=2871704 RepID=UPI0021CAFA40|nr:hypothetical protein [Acidiphilium sp. AL]MCU4161576.1 hypothetical protein [Acidiphilium sp. AL]